ncbi:MAG: hypothetical protein ACXV8X_11275 [Candidatus Angelobacter sp.]
MKQAVVIIHGIGEQKPMDTLRSFADALLGKSETGQEAYWSKPDPMSELLETRRLQALGRPMTHFYEYYWAYNVEGTKLLDVLYWLSGLIMRRGRDVPESAKALWWLSRILVGLLIVLTLLNVPAQLRMWFTAQPTLSAAWILVVVAGLLLQLIVVHYLGDAARYLSPRPQNIRLRHTIRSEGLQLLRTLHKRGEYDRIILVGHSLGSVIGYDLITHLWQEFNEQYPDLGSPDIQAKVRECMDREVSPQPVIRDLLSLAGEKLHEVRSEEGVRQYQETQREAWRELRLFGNPWRISDFITLGSPLAHAMLLLAGSGDDFEKRKRQRELATCPPQRDKKGYGYSSPTPVDIGEGRKFTPLTLHHAAPFAVTRWTNMYFPARLAVFGDLVGGPLHQVFGPGIRDVPVSTGGLAGLAKFTPLSHTHYWHAPDADHKPDRVSGAPPSLSELKETMGLSFLRKYTPRDWVQLRDSKVSPSS